MTISITSCESPTTTVTGSSELKWSYATQAAATTASTSRFMYEAAERFAMVEAKLQCACDNPKCKHRHVALNGPLTIVTSVERGFLGSIFSFFGGKGWRAVIRFSYSAEVWCEDVRQA